MRTFGFLWLLSAILLVPARSEETIVPQKISPPVLDHSLQWLVINLKAENNTYIAAKVFNFRSTDIKGLKWGTILDPDPIEKVEVQSKDGEVQFQGIQWMMALDNLTESDFITIPAYSFIEIRFDLAQTYDLSKGGEYTVKMSDKLSTAGAGWEPDGSVPYQSNDLTMKVDGPKAKRSWEYHNV